MPETSSSETVIRQTPPVTSVTSTSNTDSWKYRRRFMLWITVFNMVVIVLSLLYAKHESVAQLAVISAFGSLTAIFGFYVVGAVWDDHSSRQFQLAGLQAANFSPEGPKGP